MFLGADGYGGPIHFFKHLDDLKPKNCMLIMTKVPPSLFLKRLKRRKDHRFKYFNKDIEYSRGVSINEVDNFYKNIKKVGKILFPIFTNIEIKEEFNKLGVEVNNLNWTTFEFLENLHKKKGTKKELICMCGSDPYVKGLDYLIEVFKNHIKFIFLQTRI